jgi:peptidoglycan/LPS O-acetylase OafA/YrhL
MNTVRFDALTGFRAIAASMVFVYHNRKYWSAKIHPELLRLINEFHIGVALFFVLSGFLIAYTYAEKPTQSIGEYKKYIVIRLARILPLYWLILTAYYLDPEFGKMQFSWLNYSLCHGFSAIYNLQAITQAWSLSVEMMFYMLAPFLCLLHKKHILWLICFLCGLFMLTWAVGEIWKQINGNKNQFFYPIEFILGSTFPGRSSEFFAGMILANVLGIKKIETLSRFKHKTLIGIIGILSITYLIGQFQPDIYHHGTDKIAGRLLHIFILPFFIVMALAGLITERTTLQRILASKIMMLLGNASFAFYLIHISYVNIRLRLLWLGPDRNFILLWIISILLYLFFEKPIYNSVRKRFK